MRRPTVSVVVPVYNGQRYLAEALESVVAQDYRPLDLIVVDDGSTDDSSSTAKGFPEVRYVFQENRGVAAARNAGISAAKGDIVALLDQDDRWLPGKLTAQVAFLNERPELGVVSTKVRLFLETGVAPPRWFNPSLLDREHSALLPSTLAVRRRLFDKVGLFDTRYETGSDSDWLLRAKLAGEAVPVLPKVLVERRIHSENQSANPLTTPELLHQLRTWVKARRDLSGGKRGED